MSGSPPACSIWTEDPLSSLRPPLDPQKLSPSHTDGIWAPGRAISRPQRGTARWSHFSTIAGAGPAHSRKSCCYFRKVDGLFFFSGPSQRLTDGHRLVQRISTVVSEALQRDSSGSIRRCSQICSFSKYLRKACLLCIGLSTRRQERNQMAFIGYVSRRGAGDGR